MQKKVHQSLIRGEVCQRKATTEEESTAVALRYVLKISFQLFLVDFGVDLGARPQGHSELWPKGLSQKMPKSNKNNGR